MILLDNQEEMYREKGDRGPSETDTEKGEKDFTVRHMLGNLNGGTTILLMKREDCQGGRGRKTRKWRGSQEKHRELKKGKRKKY